ncbi:unnamed protein product [Prunus brigantina]
MLPSDMTMSTNIQVAFGKYSACLTVAPRVPWYPDSCGARSADHVDYGPLNPANLRLGWTLCHQDLPGN